MKVCPKVDCDISRLRKVPGECCPRCTGKYVVHTDCVGNPLYILANRGLPQHIYCDIAGVPVNAGIPRLAITDCTVAVPTKPVTSTFPF